MVEIEDDFEVAWRRSRGLVDDRDLFLLGTALERIAQAEHPRRDDGPRRGPSKPVDRSLDRARPFRVVDNCVGIIRVFRIFGLVAIGVIHTSTVRPISGIAGRGPVGCAP